MVLFDPEYFSTYILQPLSSDSVKPICASHVIDLGIKAAHLSTLTLENVTEIFASVECHNSVNLHGNQEVNTNCALIETYNLFTICAYSLPKNRLLQ